MATITVPAETPRKQVVVGGTAQTSFTFDFVIYDVTTDIRLFNGATELTIGSDFTVSGTAGTDGGFDGGTVTMAGSFSSGLSNVTVTILSKIAIKRISNLASTGPLDIDLLNKDLNRTVSMLQKFEERQDRMPALEEETSITLPIAFPAPSASKIISWNSGATGLEATLSTSDVTGAAASATAAATSATAASTSQTASATSATASATSATASAASATAAAASAAAADGGGPGVDGTGTDEFIRMNANTITGNVTIPTGKNGMSAGPITIQASSSVTVSSGAVWHVIGT